ncbi:MAG: thiol:disulfide interchange protein DsbA/DsbL [Gammaproteobacteria bacterium]|nr:thiol:disulfide interchange protein DsbA/DsbL [Gammaproteobacteria bacterium]
MNTRILTLALVAGILLLPLSAAAESPLRFEEGVHYTLLETPVPTRNADRVEIVKAFSYGCPPCFILEHSVAEWPQLRSADVDFWQFPAVWNQPMAIYARAYFAAEELDVLGTMHWPLFNALVVEQRRLSNAAELAGFVATLGVDEDAFLKACMSSAVRDKVSAAKAQVRRYNLASAPEFIVNGKYRVDRVRAGGLEQMLDVVDFLVELERGQLAASR